MSKKIKVFRNFTFSEMAQEDPEVKAWFNGSFRAVGPYYAGKVPGSGLSFSEQKLLLPEVIGVEPSDKDFRKAVTRFYEEILTKIPADGLQLEVGLDDDSRPVSEDNMPINVKDFITYRHLKYSPDVAENKDTAERYGPLKKFYLVDESAAVTEAVAVSELEDRAFTMYINTKDDLIKVDQILTMMGVNIKNLRATDKLLEFKKLGTKDASVSAAEQKDKLNRFIDLCQDKDLPIKFLIQELVGAQVLERVGTNILMKESGAVLGENMKDAVLFLNNPKNSKTLNILKAEYQAKVKKEASLAPETVGNDEVTPHEGKAKK